MPAGDGKGWSRGKEFAPRLPCLQCGGPFYAPPSLVRRGGGKYCSVTCRGKGKSALPQQRISKPCKGCGREFEDYPCHADREYCSPECGFVARRTRKSWGKACRQCGVAMPSRNDEFCGRACYDQWRGANQSPLYRGGKTVPRLCEQCGTAFEASKHDTKKGMGKFCSKACHGAWQSSHGEKTYTSGKGGRRADLDNRYFRSSWEANWARYLNHLIHEGSIVSWEYEVQTFEFAGIKRGTRFYTPDFRVTHPDGRVEFHEVKGYMDPRSRTKLDRMGRYHREVRIVLIDRDRYRAMAEEMAGRLPGWEMGRI